MLPDAVTLDVILDVLFDDIDTANAKLAPIGLRAVPAGKPGEVRLLNMWGDVVGNITQRKVESVTQEQAEGDAPAWTESQRIDSEQDYEQITRRFVRHYEGDNVPKFDAEASEDQAILARIRARKLVQTAPTTTEQKEEDARITSLIERMGGKSVDSTSDARTINNVMRHAYRVLSQEEKEQMAAVKDMGLKFWELIDSLGSSRELSNAKTRIEEAVMWATKSITK